MKKLLSFILSFVMVSAVAFSWCNSQAQASVSKKKIAAAYREFLYDSYCTGFRLFDINKDGKKELLTTYDGFGTNVYSVYVYTYRGKKVVSCNTNGAEYSMYGFNYNKSSKRLYGYREGGGSVEQWYYKLSKKKLNRVKLQMVESGCDYSTNEMTYKYFFRNKEITQSQYNKKCKAWSKNLQALKFHEVTDKNIKKYIK